MADPSADPIETRLRLLTWNVWWRFGPWEARQPAISATLRRLAPDVIALQETWEEAPGSGQPHRLASELGYEVVFGEGFRVGDHSFGNAVLSRWPITESEVHRLPATETTNELRNVLKAVIDGPRGPFEVYTTHLNWRFEQSAIRQEQVRAICEVVASSTERSYPPILVGDFNADPLADEIRMLTGRSATPVDGLVFHDAWDVAGAGECDTWDNANLFARGDLEPSRRIDYVFVGWPYAARGGGHPLLARVEGTTPVDGCVGSDHWAVYAELRY